ncbi:alpha/beta fold hydrolase [Cryptosporangium minutisporangium]|uniref:Alpha/beta hydrolase n=1 Tax=Cryptosporangium minutisporangium TaxID=113569 RepID=A0ABP6T4R4_9ACTN
MSDVLIAQRKRVPGAELYVEARGSGPVLLLIPGGTGEAASFGALPHALADTFTVVTYDRRGFGRSRTGAPPDDDRRLTDDVEDALALLNDAPGYVLGSSSGAIVALHLVARCPERVRRVVAHEPPLVPLLPDAARWLALFDDVHATYRSDGAAIALRVFSAAVGLRTPEPSSDPYPTEMLPRMASNQEFFLEHELRQYVRRVPDLRALKRARDRLVLAGGRESRDVGGYLLPYRPNQVLASRLNLSIAEFPGAHVGYLTDPDEFATVTRAVLSPGR